MKKNITIIACLAAVAALAPAAPSWGHGPAPQPEPDVLAEGLVSPLHLAIGTNKSVYVTQDFAGTLSRVNRDKSVETVYQAPQGWGVAGVETRGAATFFLETKGAGQGDPTALGGYLKSINPRGAARTIADLAEHERSTNPDAGQHYGFAPGTSEQCLTEAAAVPQAPPAQYTGALDSNPYAAYVQGNRAYVADAGANAILKVSVNSGAVATLAVLPPRPAVLTADAAAALGAPSCAGFEYAFEPVPTDVEMGPDGWLYVSSLPGGPEIPALGDRGAIFKVSPWTGEVKLWVEYILSPTGLAVANNGDVYVASLFGNQILKFNGWKGHRTGFLAVGAPADVEIHGRTLYATADALGGPPPGPGAAPSGPPQGKVVKADLR
ncbi:ScyD/ScyE family protein [Pseudarthrobacter phenanthrenivorans]|uniref:ScyD/ScyE family protein n=1 Tax=Pseudarthrobacter phenanthrenivorans TaxID=361575 RepID=A0A3B0FJN2_PSEPS|nr:ScyD/ScyE family protein [Pseudarthrobacter phenanthrenivorans]RKO23113.1 ScyD/ScyE family protein [Pseudarthrobacter phenanthrenivorans]